MVVFFASHALFEGAHCIAASFSDSLRPTVVIGIGKVLDGEEGGLRVPLFHGGRSIRSLKTKVLQTHGGSCTGNAVTAFRRMKVRLVSQLSETHACRWSLACFLGGPGPVSKLGRAK